MANSKNVNARDRDADDATAPLLPPTLPAQESAPRKWQDVPWLVAYLLTLALTAAGAIYAGLHRDTDFASKLSREVMGNPDSCPAANRGRELLQAADGGGGDEGHLALDAFLHHALLCVALSVGGALVISGAFLALLRANPLALVGAAIGLQVALPALASAAALYQGALGVGSSLLVLTGLMVLLFVLWKEQVVLVTRLLGLSGGALLDNLGLVGVALGLQLGMAVMVAPLLLSMVLAYMNGALVYNPARAPGDVDQCVDVDGNPVMCCAWQVQPWVPAYLSLSSVSLLWTTFLAFEIKVFTVSGTVAQWFFAPVSQHAGLTSPAGSPALRSLRTALGPALGSLCLGSAILTLLSLLRQSLEKLRKESERNFGAYLLYTAISFVYGLMEYLTKFATVRMAISGEPFLVAGRNVVDLLKRNFMDAFGVWWLPPLILQNCALVTSAAWAGVTGAVAYGMWGKAEMQSVWLLSAISLFAAWAVLAFACSVLLNIIDALFVCFAMDRDAHTCTKLEVHEVYNKLPTVGPLVENPDGEVAYGAPSGRQAQP